MPERQSRLRRPKLKNAAGSKANKARTAKAGKTARRSTNGYDPVTPARVAEIRTRLDERYPAATCALKHHSAWELLGATILSAQSTDATVNKVTPEIFKKYPTTAAFAALKPEQLEPDVRSTGFFRNKSKSVIGAAQGVMENFGGQVP